MPTAMRASLEDYKDLQYPFQVIVDPDGGFVIRFPDLPGCITEADSPNEIGSMAEDARILWIEAAYNQGLAIPLPSYPEEYSGKFNVRLPRSLHRSLAEGSEREGVSLNQYVVMLLSRGDADTRVARRLNDLESKLDAIQARLRYPVSGVPGAATDQRALRLVTSDYADDVDVAF